MRRQLGKSLGLKLSSFQSHIRLLWSFVIRLMGWARTPRPFIWQGLSWFDGRLCSVDDFNEPLYYDLFAKGSLQADGS